MTSRPEPASATDTASAPEAFAADGPKGRGGPAELPEDLRRLSSPWQPPGLKGTLTIVVGAAAVAWSAAGSGFSPSALAEGAPAMGSFLSRLWPPDFGKAATIVELLVETLQMAVLGTLLGALLSLLLSFAAAENIAPRPVYLAARFVLNVLRSVPELIFALMFVSAVGLGPFAGILAITLGSVGTIAKVYAEAIESVAPGPVTALRAAGASSGQVITFGMLPQAAPMLTSYTLLLFEGNVRGATILGLVGAGGIGLELTTALRLYDFGHLCAIVIGIVLLVTVIDRLSALVRARLTA
ncbi:phosphonate ABC transporter, permease protein PhnE [Nocardiopsis dassonvillei]|uniref:phosphonate ABC transporter, permease protein PhnE n=1 Tax=Nocardiopsis dassonvillei TaxID=2014 RepID=UPI0020104B7A|nr:phosphonate ABC transporter, permease protein PhnE [Nocardiopsis dassonvillei]MCK9870567.1 phosphonate ABC transporter, permease protein PhnE [Nocardiopsis dassonvillei]